MKVTWSFERVMRTLKKTNIQQQIVKYNGQIILKAMGEMLFSSLKPLRLTPVIHNGRI